MKNQKGVTLIALVVTIIVLIIIAGIAIATLLGDNGVITRSKQAKQDQIKGEVRDQITLAVASAKMLAEQESAKTSTGFLAESDLLDASSKIKADLVAELPATKGYTVGTPSANSTAGTTDVVITYQTKAWEQATNTQKAAITVTVSVDGNKMTIGEYNYAATGSAAAEY